MCHKARTPQEAGQGRQSEISAERSLHRTQKHDIKAGAVAPVAVSFRIDAVRAIIFHRQSDRGDGPVDDAYGQFRVFLSHRQRAKCHAGIADLIPVMLRGQPGIVPFLQGWLQSFPDDGFTDSFSGGFRQLSVQPVISDGHSHGHFCHVQKMGWIPVAECRNRQHLTFRPIEVFPFPGHSICIRQLEDPSDGFP